MRIYCPQITLTKQFGIRRSSQGGSGKGNHLYSALNRQNGSIRLNTTTMVNNNNTPNDLIANTFKIIQYQNKSLQESLRTSSIHHHHHNHHNHYGGSCRAHRLRCVSVSSQSTLMTSLSKNDVFAPTTYTSVMAATIPTGCNILLDDDLHKQQQHLQNTPQNLPSIATTDIDDAKLSIARKSTTEPVHENIKKLNNHISSESILDNNNSRKSSLKTLESLSEKLPWKTRRKKSTPVFFRNNSNSSSTSAGTGCSYTCNINNNLHNCKKSNNVIIELSNTSPSTSDIDQDEETNVVRNDPTNIEIGDKTHSV